CYCERAVGGGTFALLPVFYSCIACPPACVLLLARPCLYTYVSALCFFAPSFPASSSHPACGHLQPWPRPSSQASCHPLSCHLPLSRPARFARSGRPSPAQPQTAWLFHPALSRALCSRSRSGPSHLASTRVPLPRLQALGQWTAGRRGAGAQQGQSH